MLRTGLRVLYAAVVGIISWIAFMPLSSGQSVTITASGDVLLDRGVATQVQEHGYTYPFAHVKKTLRSADIAFANLECPLTTNGIEVNKHPVFKANPKMAACLVDGGLKIMSCANNHSMDCGRVGITETMDTLKSHGIKWCGAGPTLPDALTPTIITVHGVRVAFVGFCQFLPEGVFIRDDRPTLAMATDDNVRQAVTAARKQADIVVASFHWGIEFTDRPTDLQRHLAHVAAECGADLVFGHHPHVTQALEVVKNNGRVCLIDYSLGNFVFDQHLGFNKDPESTIILKVIAGKHGLREASIIPITIHHCAPSIAEGSDGDIIVNRLAGLSSELGTVFKARSVVLTAAKAR